MMTVLRPLAIVLVKQESWHRTGPDTCECSIANFPQELRLARSQGTSAIQKDKARS